MQTAINTDRLFLNTVTTGDYQFIHELVNTKGWLQFIGDRKVHTTEDAIRYIKKIMDAPDTTYWVVRTKENGTPAGIISFLKRQYLEHFDIGFAFLPQFAGKGYAYEAAREVLSRVTQHPEYSTVLATTVPGNANSIGLLAKLGFVFQKPVEVENETLHVYANAP